MPPSKRAAPRPQETPPRRREPERQVGVHVHNGRKTVRAARIVVFQKHVELTMGGFEMEDLSDLKDEHPMRWSKEDQCWLVPRWALDDLCETLERMGFIVRLFDAE